MPFTYTMNLKTRLKMKFATYGITKATIKTLQTRIREDEEFSVKPKNTKGVDDHVFENLKIFFENKIIG